MIKATEIIKYADIDTLEEHIEHIEVQLNLLKRKHKTDESLKLEHRILSKRFNELLEQE